MKKFMSMLMIVVICLGIITSPAYATTFSDVPAMHWAYSEITELTEKGIINGMGDGTFAPDAFVTRAQFIKLLVLSAGIDVFDMAYFQNDQTRNPQIEYFQDVKQIPIDEDEWGHIWGWDWAAQYVYTAVMNNIIKYADYTSEKNPDMSNYDYSDKNRFFFMPDQPISRDEAARYISRALELMNGEALTFSDVDSIAYGDDVAKTVKSEILKGFEDNTFRPQSNTTRAEMAVIMGRVLNYAEQNPVHKKTFEKMICKITKVDISNPHNINIYANEITPYTINKAEWDNYKTGDVFDVNGIEYYVYKDGADLPEGGLTDTLEPNMLGYVDISISVFPYGNDNYVLRINAGGGSMIYKDTGRQVTLPLSDDFYYFDYDGEGAANWFEYCNKASFIDKCAEFETNDYPNYQCNVTLQIVDGKILLAYKVG